jgi:capsular exopolysaccharide synthesis family protein
MIPILQGEDAERAALLDPSDHQEQTLQENFRVIRTNLISMGTLTKAPHVIMVTSSLPKEGKTVVSSNLAVSFSQMGARTLLIDADLRRGRIHRLFGLRKTPGLSSILLDKLPLEDALRPTGKDNLHVMTAGEHLNTGTELLSSARFAELLTELRGRYDRIIIDTPPVLGLSETSAIQQVVDGVVFVAWCGRTPIKTMQVSIEMLANNGANFYGFVLNRLDLNSATNYYQYYYYSNDYYRNYHALENA